MNRKDWVDVFGRSIWSQEFEGVSPGQRIGGVAVRNIPGGLQVYNIRFTNENASRDARTVASMSASVIAAQTNQ